MRLVCPNCEAKYEVPEDAIPETGRDVQCANCGHAWYQMRPRAAGAETAAPGAPPSALAPVPQPVAEPVAEASVMAAEEAPAREPLQDPASVEAVAVEVAPAEADIVPEPAIPSGEVSLTEGDEAIEAVAAEVDAALETADLIAGEPADVAPSFESVRVATDTFGTAIPELEALADDVTVEPIVEEFAAAAPVDTVPVDVVMGDLASVGTSPIPEAAVAEVVVAGDAVVTDAASAVDIDTPEPDLPPAAAPEAAAYAVDESVLAILREEAEREAQARRSDVARPLETQTDLGIDAALTGARKMVEDVGQVTEPESDDKLSARRTRLPDVEEINSTLRPSETGDDGTGQDGTMPVAEGRSSFRSGFLLVMTVAILGSALYGSADAIAELVPSIAGPLKAFVSFVDSLRLQLDGLMQSATVAINGT